MHVVPAGHWQAARTTGDHTLVGCTVGPGFDFADFALLADEPVTAGPPSAAYRLRKFVNRNRAGVVAAGLFLALLVAGLVATTSLWTLADRRYDEVLGLHICGHHATDLISEGGIALTLEATLEELVHTIHPHPTLSEVVGEVAHAALYGNPLHF